MNKYRLSNIVMKGHEHGELRKDTIYAELIDPDGHSIISATLDYIMAAIRDRGYNVEGVTVVQANDDVWKKQSSSIKLDLYGEHYFPNPVAKLVDGMIPAHTECQYKKCCARFDRGSCRHRGMEHSEPYACSAARLFDR